MALECERVLLMSPKSKKNPKLNYSNTEYVCHFIGFKYAKYFNEGVLQLQENGVLAKLEKKWWQERRGGGACSVIDFKTVLVIN